MRWIFCFPGSSTLAYTATPLSSPGTAPASLLSAGVDAPDSDNAAEMRDGIRRVGVVWETVYLGSHLSHLCRDL